MINNNVVEFPNAIHFDPIRNFTEYDFNILRKEYHENNRQKNNDKKDNTAEQMGNQKKIYLCSKNNGDKLIYTVHKEKNIQKNHDEENNGDDKKQNNDETLFHPLIANSFTRYIFGEKKAPLILKDDFESFSGLSMEYFNFNGKNTKEKIQLKNDKIYNNDTDYHLKQMEVVQNILDINEIKFDCHNDKEEAKKLDRVNITDYGRDCNNNQLKFYEGVKSQDIQRTDYPNDILLELLLYTLLTGKMDIKNRNVCLRLDENKKPYLVHIDYDHFTYGGKKEKKGGYNVFFDKDGWEEFYSNMCYFIIDLISPTEESFQKRIKEDVDWSTIKHISIQGKKQMAEEHVKLIDKIFNNINDMMGKPDTFIRDIITNIFLTISSTKYDTKKDREQLQWIIEKNIHSFIEKMFEFYEILDDKLKNSNLKSSLFVEKFHESIQTVIKQKQNFKEKVNKLLKKYLKDFINEETVKDGSSIQKIYYFNVSNNNKRLDELENMSSYDKNTRMYRETKEQYDRKQKYRKTKYLIKNMKKQKQEKTQSYFDKFTNLFNNCNCDCQYGALQYLQTDLHDENKRTKVNA